MELVIAIDIGGSLTKVGLVSREGKIVGKMVFPTEAQRPFQDFTSRLEKTVKGILEQEGAGATILQVGVGAPNANPFSGAIENPPNLSWGQSIPVAATIEQLFSYPVTLANDANAAALGELTFGSARGMKNFVMLTLGTGLGSGIVVDGKLLIGEHGLAGELGHVNVDPNGRMCNCGLNGCLETYASVTGIRRTVFELLAERKEDSAMRDFSFEMLSGENISEAAINGDMVALKAFERTGEVLGSKMADTVAHLDPEAFILSGGLSKAGEILLGPIRKSLEKYLFIAYKGKVRVLLSKATREEAILGPAALAWMAIQSKNS